MQLEKEEYEKVLQRLAPQLAEILSSGKSVKISRSRSGIKIFAVIERHVDLNKSCSETTGSVI